MPLYDYRCRSCAHEFEVQQSIADDALTTCPQCGGELRKVFSPVGISFKGSGFYKNDARSASKASAGSRSSSGNGSSSANGSSSESGSSSDSGSSSGSSDSGGSTGGSASPAPATTGSSQGD